MYTHKRLLNERLCNFTLPPLYLGFFGEIQKAAQNINILRIRHPLACAKSRTVRVLNSTIVF